MKAYKNGIFFLITVLAVLFQLAYPTAAYADDEPPVLPTDVATEEAPPAAEEAPAEAVPTEATPVPGATEEAASPADGEQLPAATPAPVLEESSESRPPTAEATAAPPEEEAPLLEALEQLPAETEVVVLDESGEVVPLATQEAAEIITGGDPMWCPAGAAVVTADCVNAATVTALLPLLNSQDQNGIIYFTSSYTINDVTFDGTNTNLDQLADNSLTLQGGWDGVTTVGSTIAYAWGSAFSGGISITNWNAQIAINEITTPTITISDVTISNASGNGISITKSYHSDIVIDHVTITGLQNQGDALAVVGAGNITITDSQFHSNSGSGLSSDHNNDVTVVNSSFNSNGLGLYSWNSGDITITNSQFNNNGAGLVGYDSGVTTITDSQFNNNSQSGFEVDDNGAITITNSQFNNNGENGLYADCRTLQVTNSQLNGNGHQGLSVHASGDITITNSHLDNNGRGGMYAHDVQNVTITGSSFNDNGGNGFYATEWEHDAYDLGNLTIVNSYFDNNAITGLEVDPDEEVTIGIITLNGISANGNGNTSITIHDLTAPAITINNVIAPTIMIGNVTISNAPGNGISITNSPGSNVTIDHVTVTGSQSNGLYVDHIEDITITGSQFNNNTLYGVVADKACSLSISSTVFSGNGSGDYLVSYADCKEDDPKLPPPAYEVTSHEKVGLDVDCSHQSRYDVRLPNGDRVQLVCPFSGNPRIWHMDRTDLPADLPAGNTYASALALEIWQDGAAIQYIREGGRINISFEVPSQEPGTTYSILYWDNGTWVLLKDFVIDENGHPRVFSLSPGDPRQILSGVQFVQKYGSLRAEVSTNFPGIFVLVH
ncbi:MAG TPA: right-handed parallel beta-helix repeat-containing protein [Anaerolineales bacterium]|nr:right-handed parallel beta-helix repeat-containing protein [Anaerolineales bacterium]